MKDRIILMLLFMVGSFIGTIIGRLIYDLCLK